MLTVEDLARHRHTLGTRHDELGHDSHDCGRLRLHWAARWDLVKIGMEKAERERASTPSMHACSPLSCGSGT